MGIKTINLSLPEELLKSIDQELDSNYVSRSDFIRRTMQEKLTKIQSEREMLAILKKGNTIGQASGINSEQEVWDIIDDIKNN